VVGGVICQVYGGSAYVMMMSDSKVGLGGRRGTGDDVE